MKADSGFKTSLKIQKLGSVPNNARANELKRA
jgi:hypothetical protein